MQASAKQLIEQTAQGAHAGELGFGTVVSLMLQAGVESYHADYRLPATTYYLPGGDTYTVSLLVPGVQIPQAFDISALQAAIRGAQRGEVKYPEFMQLSMAAGCVGYMVWIAGRQVTYFGRRGEQHIEPFPAAN